MLICYSQACQNTNNPTKLMKNSKTDVIIMITINLSCKKLSSLLISMILNKEPLRYGTAMKLGLIVTVDIASPYEITSSFKLNEWRKFKMKKEHHCGACYFYLLDLMGNVSCHP